MTNTHIKSISLFAFVTAAIVSLAFTASGQTLKADYRFNGDLNSSVSGAPAMTNLTGASGPNVFVSETVDGYPRQTLRFPNNSGVAVNTTGTIPNNAYTVVILFKMDALTGYRRVMDTTDGLDDDCGAYIFDSRFDGESTANTNSVIFPDTYVQATIVREASGRIRAYRDGRLKVDVANDGGCFQILSNTIRFFQDDNDVTGDSSAGNVARIRLYDAPMTDAQVQATGRTETIITIGGPEQPILFYSDRDGNYEIYSMFEDGSRPARLTQNTVTDSHPDWSPVRGKIAFRSNRDGNSEIYLMNPDGSSPQRLTNDPWVDYSPRWSPDGNKILFSRCEPVSGVCDLWTMNPDGTGQVNITNTAFDDDQGRWSPDGNRIIFAALRDAVTYEIYTSDANGSNVVRITNNTFNDLAPVFSPDGSKIAFESTRDGAWPDIYSMNANGSAQTRLTFSPATDWVPVWSPDGSKIMYASYDATSTPTVDAGDEIFVMNADGTGKTRLTFNNRWDRVSDWRGEAPSTLFDYDGDGRADLTVRRPTDNTWYLLRSTAGYTGLQWGVAGDRMAPADYDGDRKTDIAVFRPSDGRWYIVMSGTNTFQSYAWGADGDLPVPTDRDNDGKADLVVFRGSNSTWYASSTTTGPLSATAFGTTGDRPQLGDFDGDGRGDTAVFRPSSSTWYVLRSSGGFTAQTWGQAEDVPVPADYDGDGATDLAVFRPSTGQWFLSRSTAGLATVNWGQAGDVPVAADYDADGKADAAVFRPAEGMWYMNRSTAGFLSLPFGQNGDVPTPSAFIY